MTRQRSAPGNSDRDRKHTYAEVIGNFRPAWTRREHDAVDVTPVSKGETNGSVRMRCGFAVGEDRDLQTRTVAPAASRRSMGDR